MEVQALPPGVHGMALHEAVGILARDAAFDQIKQQLPTEDEAARTVQIGEHARWIHEHRLDQVGGFVQQVVGERSGVGNDNALRRRVRDIALVPKRHVFKSSLRIRTDDACQSTTAQALYVCAHDNVGGRFCAEPCNSDSDCLKPYNAQTLSGNEEFLGHFEKCVTDPLSGIASCAACTAADVTDGGGSCTPLVLPTPVLATGGAGKPPP